MGSYHRARVCCSGASPSRRVERLRRSLRGNALPPTLTSCSWIWCASHCFASEGEKSFSHTSRRRESICAAAVLTRAAVGRSSLCVRTHVCSLSVSSLSSRILTQEAAAGGFRRVFGPVRRGGQPQRSNTTPRARTRTTDNAVRACVPLQPTRSGHDVCPRMRAYTGPSPRSALQHLHPGHILKPIDYTWV